MISAVARVEYRHGRDFRDDPIDAGFRAAMAAGD